MASKTQVARHLEPWQELTGKVVMVTGASAGLGREFCLDLAKAGCMIIAAARRTDRLKSLCDAINEPAQRSNDSPRAVAVELDVSGDGKSIEASVDKAWEAFGRIDALVNNAGVRVNVLETEVYNLVNGNTRIVEIPTLSAEFLGKEQENIEIPTFTETFLFISFMERVYTPLDLTEEEFDDAYMTNLRGTWLVTKYVCIRMRDSKQAGSVINIASIGGLNRGHLPGGLAYDATKAAVNTMTKVMAVELGVHKIRVNGICPGLFKSEITAGLMQRDFLETVAKKTVPLGTFGTSDPALTSLVRYLIHDSSQYVSGNIYIVEAGATLPGFTIFSSL